MNNGENIYSTDETSSDQGLKFTFISKGPVDVIKVIQYAYVQPLQDRGVYNLGFGDYDLENDLVIDHISTNNGDGRKVFNTVLYTIPLFFDQFPEQMLLVRGSDSRSGLKEQCRQTCQKDCGENCRKFNQRIRIYTCFINLHFDTLNVDYQFSGGYLLENDQVGLEDYVRGREYTAVLLMKRNT